MVAQAVGERGAEAVAGVRTPAASGRLSPSSHSASAAWANITAVPPYPGS